jgi:threonine aldolase
MRNRRGFASDNNAGIHPKILEAISKANKGHVIAYGDDRYTQEALDLFKEKFGSQVETFFVFNGTAANVLGLKALTQSYHSIICSEIAHLHMDECGAPEKFIGCKILTVPSSDGKLTLDGIKKHLVGFDFEHHAQPRVISITQSTEMGTVYKIEEIKVIADLAHQNNLFLHMDGARLANAAVSLGCSLREMITNTGVDVLSFGGTKNGILLGEAIVFFDPRLSDNFKYIRKQGMQLGSKMRFIAIQFSALFKNNLWLKNAKHANMMASYLAKKVKGIPGIKITQPVEANGVFAIIPPQYIAKLQKEFFFYIWNENSSEVRWMTSFDTTQEDVDSFVDLIKKTVKE